MVARHKLIDSVAMENHPKIKTLHYGVSIMSKRVSALISLSLIFVAVAFTACEKESGPWAVKINDKTAVTITEFERLYYFQNKLMLNLETNEEVDKIAANPQQLAERVPNPQQRAMAQVFLNKETFMQQLVDQKLLYHKALEDKDIDQDELKSVIEAAKLKAVMEYYLTTKLEEKVKISQQELEEAYAANIEMFQGRTAAEVEPFLRQQMMQQKLGVESKKFVDELKAESTINKKGFQEWLKKQEDSTSSSEADSEEKTEETPTAE